MRDVRACVRAFEHRAARLVRDASEQMPGGAGDEEGFQRYMIDWIRAAKAHCAVVVLRNFQQGVAEASGKCSQRTCAALNRLLALHALTGAPPRALTLNNRKGLSYTTIRVSRIQQ